MAFLSGHSARAPEIRGILKPMRRDGMAINFHVWNKTF